MQIRLLLVEDNETIRTMYQKAFTAAGIEVATSEDGTIIAESTKFNPPDIIIMDVMMPNFNGLETLQEIKANVLTRGIPVIMLSAYDDYDLIQKALRLGASRYLVKSAYEPQQIVEIIMEVLAEQPHY